MYSNNQFCKFSSTYIKFSKVYFLIVLAVNIVIPNDHETKCAFLFDTGQNLNNKCYFGFEVFAKMIIDYGDEQIANVSY